MSRKITEQDILEVVDDFSRSIFEVGGVTPHAPHVTNDGIARVRVTNEFGAHVVIKFQAEYSCIGFGVDGRTGSHLKALVTDYARQALRRFSERLRRQTEDCLNADVSKFPNRSCDDVADEIINNVIDVYGCSEVFTQQFLNYLKQLIAAELRKKDSQIDALRAKVEAMARVNARK